MSTNTNHKFPIRDIQDLYAFRATVQCATQNTEESLCVPCAYKICAFDVAQDYEFVKMCPNQRPEMCPRERCGLIDDDVGSLDSIGYSSDMSVLCCGDGDFTFSLAIARKLFGSYDSKDSIRRNNIDPPKLIASSYESKETLLKVYPGINDTIRELIELGAQVLFQVDATKLKNHLKQNGIDVKCETFDRVIWNFPCTAIQGGQDGQNQQMEENKELVKKFVIGASKFLTTRGEIHMCHKTKPPYNQWKIEEVALEGFANKSKSRGNESSSNKNITYKGRIVLDRSLFPPYKPRKALDKKSFSVHDAAIYVFGWNKASNALSTISENDDNDDHIGSVVKVVPRLIEQIRSLHEKKITKYKNKRTNSFASKGSSKRHGQRHG